MTKVIWITGATSGFGLAVTLKLLRETDHTICISARSKDKLQWLNEQGAYTYRCDMSNYEQIQQTVKGITSDHGRIDVVCCNAGYGVYGPIEAVPHDAMVKQFEVNVFGVVDCIREVLPQMRERRSGRIVLTSSSAAYVSSAGMGYYASTKHSIKALGTALRQEVKPFNIDVSMIEPGVVKTAFKDRAMENQYVDSSPKDYQQKMQQVKRFMLKSMEKAPTVERTRDQMIHAILDDKPRTIYKSTATSYILCNLSKWAPPKVYDTIIDKGVELLSK